MKKDEFTTNELLADLIVFATKKLFKYNQTESEALKIIKVSIEKSMKEYKESL